MAKPRTTAKADYRKFKAECERMIKILGLQEWAVVFSHECCGDAFADISVDHQGRIAYVRFNLYAPPAMAAHGYDPVRTARHEMLELLLAPLVRLANSRTILAGEVETATHAVIRRLEGMSFDR